MSSLFRHHRSTAVVAGILLSIIISTSASAAVAWSRATTLRAHDQIAVVDADFEGQLAAVAWAEDSSVGPGTRIRVSADGGDTFGPTATFRRSATAAVDICDGVVNVAFVRTPRGAVSVIRLAVGDASGNFDVKPVADGGGFKLFTDVACTSGRVFVSWSQQKEDASGYRLLVTSALIGEWDFSAPVELGIDESDYPFGVALAAAADMAYALFSDEDGKLRLQRWSIGAGPDHALTAHAAEVVTPGQPNTEGSTPVIAADGDNVVIAWHRCAGTYARVSADGGATWGKVKRIVHFGCDAIVEGGTAPNSLAIHGDRIALVYAAGGIPNFQANYLVQTSNWFSTTQEEELGRHQNHNVGFLTVGGRVRLGDAFDKRFEVVKFRRQT